MNNFVADWRNKTLLKRINGAKSTIDNKPAANYCSKQRKMLDREIEDKNRCIARRLYQIYGEKNHLACNSDSIGFQ